MHLHGFTSGSSLLLDSFSLGSFSGSGVWAVFVSVVSGLLLFAFFSGALPSSEAFLFFSCQHCFPPFFCSFLQDIVLWTLLFGIPYFLTTSACDLLFATQSPMASSNNIEWSLMVFHTLCTFSSSVAP